MLRIKFFEELKCGGLEEAEYIENDKSIDLSKCKRRDLYLEDLDIYDIKEINFIIGDNFDFECVECDKIKINAGNNCIINIQEGKASVVAGNNCDISLSSGDSLLIENDNKIKCCDIKEIKFGNNNIIEVEEIIIDAKGGSNNNITIGDCMEVINYIDTNIELKENNKMKIGKMEITIK